MEKIYFLTFCTEGPPFDDSQNLSHNSSNLKSLLKPYFDEIFVYTKRQIKSIPGSDHFCNTYPDEFPMNPGLRSLGCGDFKSFIIDLTLKLIPEGSLLIYHDCNFQKYPQYWQTDWSRIKQTANFLLESNRSDFFFPFEYNEEQVPLMSMHGKRFTSDFILGDPIKSEVISKCREVASSRMFIRNTARARSFFSEYLKLCSNKDLLTKLPDPNPYPDFTHLCPEQRVLGCLMYKYILEGKLNPDFPKYFFRDRRLRIDDDSISLWFNFELLKFISSYSIKNLNQTL